MTNRTFATVIALVLVAAAAASRIVPHPWNFTPMIACALFGGARLKHTWTAGLATLGCLALGDLALDAFPYAGMGWVYATMLVIVLVGRLLRSHPSAGATLAGALGAGALFFVVTNFGVWASSGLYEHTAAGLAQCFSAGIPFYRNQVLGDLIFTGAFFGLHALAMRLHDRQPAPI